MYYNEYLDNSNDLRLKWHMLDNSETFMICGLYTLSNILFFYRMSLSHT